MPMTLRPPSSLHIVVNLTSPHSPLPTHQYGQGMRAVSPRSPRRGRRTRNIRRRTRSEITPPYVARSLTTRLVALVFQTRCLAFPSLPPAWRLCCTPTILLAAAKHLSEGMHDPDSVPEPQLHISRVVAAKGRRQRGGHGRHHARTRSRPRLSPLSLSLGTHLPACCVVRARVLKVVW